MINDGLRGVSLVLLSCLAASMLGCSPSATGAFDDKGYRHETYGYRVGATHPPDPKFANESLLGDSWKIDNFYHSGSSDLSQKSTEEYRIEYEFDINGDGTKDVSREDFLYDLRFKHLKRDAIIWVRTIPISDELRDKDLRVLVQRYVDEVSGAGFEAVKLGPTTTLIRERRFGASVVDRGAFKLAEQEAYECTFDVANVDEVAINPNARRTRVRIVLVRTPFEYSPRPTRGKTHKFSVLMLAGYANLPEDFATDEKDFQSLLENTTIADKRGTSAVALEPLPTITSSDAKAPAAGQPTPSAPEASGTAAKPAE